MVRSWQTKLLLALGGALVAACGPDQTGSAQPDLSLPDPPDLAVAQDLAPAPPRDLSTPPDLVQYSPQWAAWEKSPRWKLTWRDEFNGVPPNATAAEQACYTRTPACSYYINNTPEPCKSADQHPGLAELNKCNWGVYAGDNYWAPGFDNFRTDMVKVQGGELVLDVQKTGTAPPYDCGNKKVNDWEFTDVCPLKAGGIYSKRWNDPGNPATQIVPGFTQNYGRFEVRGKLSVGPGAYPAYWMLPQTGAWPDAGEIDIMEHTDDSKSEYFATIHGRSGNYHFWEGNTYKPLASSIPNLYTLVDDYHTYAVEWEAEEIRFYLDNRFIGSSKNNTPTNPFDLQQCTTTLFNAGTPFFWILFDTAKPDLSKLSTYTHVPTRVDFARAYSRCADVPPGGTWPAECVESTLRAQCPNPCGGFGKFDGWRCLVRKPNTSFGTPEFSNDGGHLYYKFGSTTTAGQCEPGDVYVSFQKGCDAGEVPKGRTVLFFNDAIYLEPLCSTTADQPNCPIQCALGEYNTSSGKCRVAPTPAGTLARVLNGKFYYDKFAGANPCPATVGSYPVVAEMAGCRVDIPVPAGKTPSIDNGFFAITANCGNSPDWQALSEGVAQSSHKGYCSNL
jgi:hypothetical protein